jgi:hypothetical protein
MKRKTTKRPNRENTYAKRKKISFNNVRIRVEFKSICQIKLETTINGNIIKIRNN